MDDAPSFDVACPDDRRCDVLVLGLSTPGLASVTAVDYLVRHLEGEEIGHVSPEGFPSITPFEDGRPRNHTRIYDLPDSALTAVVGELFVPVRAGAAFADALLEWTDRAGVEEIVVPYGIPYPHGPDEHAVFSVATDAFRDRRSSVEDVPPLGGGLLDGVVGEVMARSVNGEAPPTGAFVTPVHLPGPDLEAALRLIDALEATYGVEVDEDDLRRRSAELREYYAALADRMNAADEDATADGQFPHDRSFM